MYISKNFLIEVDGKIVNGIYHLKYLGGWMWKSEGGFDMEIPFHDLFSGYIINPIRENCYIIKIFESKIYHIYWCTNDND